MAEGRETMKLTKPIVTILTMLASPVIAAQDVSSAHSYVSGAWIWWVGLIAVVAAFAWASIASTRRTNDTGRDSEAKVLESLVSRGEIDRKDYNTLSHDLEGQARDQDE